MAAWRTNDGLFLVQGTSRPRITAAWGRLGGERSYFLLDHEQRAIRQRFEPHEDGSGVLHLKVRKADDTHHRLLSFLAPYSGQCAVLSPAWLRRQAIEHLEELAAQYE